VNLVWHDTIERQTKFVAPANPPDIIANPPDIIANPPDIPARELWNLVWRM
jgi:hypothetical protein